MIVCSASSARDRAGLAAFREPTVVGVDLPKICSPPRLNDPEVVFFERIIVGRGCVKAINLLVNRRLNTGWQGADACVWAMRRAMPMAVRQGIAGLNCRLWRARKRVDMDAWGVQFDTDYGERRRHTAPWLHRHHRAPSASAPMSGNTCTEHGAVIWLVCRRCAHIWIVGSAAAEVPSGPPRPRTRSDLHAGISTDVHTEAVFSNTHGAVAGGHAPAPARQVQRGDTPVLATPKIPAIRVETSD